MDYLKIGVIILIAIVLAVFFGSFLRIGGRKPSERRRKPARGIGNRTRKQNSDE